MRTNHNTVKEANKDQILNEYALILAKKSKLSRALRDSISVKAIAIIRQVKKDANS